MSDFLPQKLYLLMCVNKKTDEKIIFEHEPLAGQQEGVVLEGPGDVIRAHVACFLASYSQGKVTSFGEGTRLLMYPQESHVLS